MAARALFGSSSWFHDFQSSRDSRHAFALWPALMGESRNPSLLQRHYRISLALGRWRWSWILIRKLPEPEVPFNDPELAVNDLVRWSANWSKGRVTAKDIQELLLKKDLPWGRLVRFGAANYHYGRLVISREALALSRSRVASSVKQDDLPEFNTLEPEAGHENTSQTEAGP